MPIRTLAPGTAAAGTPLRSYEIDLAGSGGTLSNGTVSLGGYDFTLAGVGTSNELNLTIDLADIYADFDGSKHGIEICAKLGSITVNAANSSFGMSRAIARRLLELVLNLRVWRNKHAECSSNIDGTV